MKTYVVGHKNPDTDSVVSAVIYSKIEGYVAAVAGEMNKETEYVLERFGFEKPAYLTAEEKKIVLVDHNSPVEMDTAVKPEEIVGIIDHHKLAGPFSAEPLEVFMKPYGSTATIVANFAEGHNHNLSKQEAALLVAAIISDTLNLTSPTTTEKDKEAIEKLNEIAELDLNKLAEEMFAAKSDISDIKTAELLGKDYKVFDFGGKKVGIGVWETVKPEMVLERKEEILNELKSKKESEKLNAVFFAAVDILNNESEMFLVSETEEEIIKKAYNVETTENLVKLPGVVSRKKQIVPPIEKAIGA